MFKLENFDYELIDCGHGGRLERFGAFVLDRPCPQAMWPHTVTDAAATVFFDRKAGWESDQSLPEHWPIQVGPLKAELRFSPNGQVGIFPEQFDNWRWIRAQVEADATKPLKILNTFAYTGIATLAASQPHTEVVHVDGAKSAINWAKRNAELSGLSTQKIRWICDDVIQFMSREARRGNQYDGIILDPPAFGRGAKKDWKIERDLPELMALVRQLLTPKARFVVLTCHAPEHFSAQYFAQLLQKLPPFIDQQAEELDLTIPSQTGHSLPSSFGARISRTSDQTNTEC